MSPLCQKVVNAIASSDLPLPPPLPPRVPDLDLQIRGRVCTALESLRIRGEIEAWTLLEVGHDTVSVRVQGVFPVQFEEFRFGLRELKELSVVLDVMES